jgi:hypothetical protein
MDSSRTTLNHGTGHPGAMQHMHHQLPHTAVEVGLDTVDSMSVGLWESEAMGGVGDLEGGAQVR